MDSYALLLSKSRVNTSFIKTQCIVFIFLILTGGISAQVTNSISFDQSSQSATIDVGTSQDLSEYISTSNNTAVTVSLKALDETGNIPAWLTVNGKTLSGISYTANSEISFNFDATKLPIGTYYATVTASATGYISATLEIKLSVVLGSTGSLANFKVNFQDKLTIPPAGWFRDFGQGFSTRTSAFQGKGYMYGWIKRGTKTFLDLTRNARKRMIPADTLLSTLIHMQGRDIFNFHGTVAEGVWEAKVGNGNYLVTVSVGDGERTDSKHSINVEGVNAISQFVPTNKERFKSATVVVSVSDGFLTVDAAGGVNTKINWIIITPYTGKRPSVVSVNPDNSSINVSENTSISTNVLKLPNGGIKSGTITKKNIFLTEEATGAIIPSSVNGTGGGDALTLVPSAPLKLSTTYRFTVTAGVKDFRDSSFIPFSSTFTTGPVASLDLANVQFDKINLPNTSGQHTSLTIGPDRKLYALTIDGIIKRFPINVDGTLGTPELLYALQDSFGTRKPRLSIGLTFDPSATATNLIAWVTNDSYVFLRAPDWDGKLTRLSGPNLETVKDVLINLPRSRKDHVTNSIAFGTDGALYFSQGSTSAMGKGDLVWGNREEHLLSGTVLRLDVSKLGITPLDVKTAEGGGTYNPYNPNAPLTIYASGIRNAYDLVWHTNGNLYLPTNGSAAGGNTPASVPGVLRTDGSLYNGPVVPALTSVQQTQKDFLFRVVKGGYYGHPNPLRGEYVLNGGNPTTSIDPAEISSYPVGTLPDANYRGYAYDFQMNASPDGAIEYRSNSFNGALKGKLLVVRYSQHDDIIALTPGGADNDIISATDGHLIDGFSGFNDPLDLTEDTTNGNLYVSEFGGEKIVLLKPRPKIKIPVKDTLGPIADSYIRDGIYASNNYGTDTSIQVKGTPLAGYTRMTYFKFGLDTIKNVNRAILRIYGRNTENFSLINISAFAVNDDSWTENGITWNNAPPAEASPISSVGINNETKYYELDITDYVKKELLGDKIISLVLKDTLNQGRNLGLRSKEYPTHPPQLVITTDTLIISSFNRPVNNPVTTRAASKYPHCDDSTDVEIADIPIVSTELSEQTKVYPNPLHQKFVIHFGKHYKGPVNLQMIDAVGKTLEIGGYYLKQGGSTKEVDISRFNLNDGVYFLKIIAETKTELIKLVVH